MVGKARARLLGAELRELRVRAGLRMIDLGAKVGWDKSLLSRVERGERVASETEVAAVLGALGIVGGKRDELLAMAGEPDQPVWMRSGVRGLPKQLNALIELERTAMGITEAHPLLVPGLLQTADYARAIMIEGGVPKSDVEVRVTMRLGRQAVLTQPDPVRFVAIVDEQVLRRPLGGPKIMANQLRHLAMVAQRPNITVRVLSSHLGWHAGLYGPFVLLEFAKAPPIVHLEHLRSALFLDEPPDVAPYVDVVPALLNTALDADDSVDFICRCAEKWEGNA